MDFEYLCAGGILKKLYYQSFQPLRIKVKYSAGALITFTFRVLGDTSVMHKLVDTIFDLKITLCVIRSNKLLKDRCRACLPRARVYLTLRRNPLHGLTEVKWIPARAPLSK